MAGLRRYRRVLLLVVLPLVVLIAGLAFYLNGGRYVTTDDAYVGAQKVLITPDVAGKIISVAVKEGQHVATGDVLFQIDPVPFQLALAQARAKLADAKTSHDNLRRQRQALWPDASSWSTPASSSSSATSSANPRWCKSMSARSSTSTIATALVTAQAQLQLVKQQNSTALNQLLGDPELPLEQFPAYMQAKAALDDAAAQSRSVHGARADERHRDAGRQHPARPLRRRRHAGVQRDRHHARRGSTPIRRNRDFTYVAVGQKVDGRGRRLPRSRLQRHGRLAEPGTGAQFAILPPQNATGNFVKVVQRVPVRIALDRDDKSVRKLKAGMSAYGVDRHRPSPLAGRAARLVAGGRGQED